MTSTGPVPLTTVFTQSSNCRDVTSYLEWVDNTNYISTFSATGASWWMSLGPEDWSTCYPSGYDTSSYFSPGECPSGYTTAGVTLSSLGNEVETRATCCPSGYNAQTGESLPWYSTNPCTSSNTELTSTAIFTIDGVEASAVGTFGINAKGVSIRWQSTDFTSATCTGVSSPTSSGNGTSSSSSSGLSPGAKAGIGVGVAVAVVLLGIIAYLLYLVRRLMKPGLVLHPVEQHEPQDNFAPTDYGGSKAFEMAHTQQFKARPIEMPTGR